MTIKLTDGDVIHLLTGRTPSGINRLLASFLRRGNINMTKEQWTIMAVLWKKEGCTQQELADATDRDRPGITRLLDNLERDGFIERKPHATDRRTNLIHLTRKGKAAEAEVKEALSLTIATATKDVTHQQLTELRKIFNQINQNIADYETSHRDSKKQGSK